MQNFVAPYSRQKVINIDRRVCDDELNEALDMAIEALEQEPYEDVISRQAAIELIKNYCENGCDISEDNWCPSCQQEQFIKLLKALPSAQPEIIRCKDCKHWKFDHTCREHSLVSPMMANEFCSRAERRDVEK